MSRNAALQCHGTITFHHLDGPNVFGGSMPIRWSGSPEPVQAQIIIGTSHGVIIDPNRWNTESRVDLYPDEARKVDIAAKFDNEPECYGWSNLNYLSNPEWRNPDFKLNCGRYLVVYVTVVSGGQRCSREFRLVNDVSGDKSKILQTLSTK
jgi:hypothetical protein